MGQQSSTHQTVKQKSIARLISNYTCAVIEFERTRTEAILVTGHLGNSREAALKAYTAAEDLLLHYEAGTPEANAWYLMIKRWWATTQDLTEQPTQKGGDTPNPTPPASGSPLRMEAGVAIPVSERVAPLANAIANAVAATTAAKPAPRRRRSQAAR